MNKNFRLATFWTILFFVLSFVKTIALTPMMLQNWGRDFFCFWAIILSARSLILFLPDAYLRYIANQFNLLYYQDTESAKNVFAQGFSFLLFLSMMLLLACWALFLIFPSLGTRIFASELQYLPYCLLAYLISASIQNLQRLFATILEPLGLVWQNMRFELLLIIAEIFLMSILLLQGYGFVMVLLADSLLIVLFSIAYIILLRKKFAHFPFQFFKNLQAGGQYFKQGIRWYSSNLLEKLSSDGLVLLLSFFRYDKAAIALFATVRTIVNTPLLAQNLLLNSYTPTVQQAFALRNSIGIEKLFSFIRYKLGLLFCVGILLFLPIYQPLFVWWTKAKIEYDARFMSLMLMMAVFNLYNVSYSFAFKGMNAMPQMLGLVLCRTVALLAMLLFLPAQLISLATAWVFFELLLATFMPVVMHRFAFKQAIILPCSAMYLQLLPYLVVTVVLVLQLVTIW